MPSPLRLGLLAGLVALAACDTVDPEPRPPAFTVAVVANGDTVETADAAPTASLADVPVAAVALAPRLDVPGDPELRRRWELMQVVVAVSNAASDDEYEVGHYLIETETDAVGAAPVDGSGEPMLGFGSPWLEAPGAIFFPVLVDAETGPPRPFGPFGRDGAGRIAFEGDGETVTAEAPALVSSVISESEIALRRGTSATDVAVVVRRGNGVAGGLVAADDDGRVAVPPGDGAAEVFLFEAASDAACPRA